MGTPGMNECLFTPPKAAGLLPSFEGGQFLTTVTSHDWDNNDCPIFFQGLKKPLNTHYFRWSVLLGNPHYNWVDCIG